MESYILTIYGPFLWMMVHELPLVHGPWYDSVYGDSSMIQTNWNGGIG